MFVIDFFHAVENRGKKIRCKPAAREESGFQLPLTLVLYKGDIFLEPRIFEVRLLEILTNSVFQVIS